MPKESTKVSKKQEEVEVDNNSEDDDHLIHINDFDVDKITLPTIDEKRSSDSRYHAFPTYQFGKAQDKIVFQTDEIKITKGGIPKLDEKWRKNDSKREFFWLGWDKEQESCNKLFQKLKEIDEKFDGLISYDSDEKVDHNVESKTVYTLRDKKKEPLTVLEYSPLVRMSVQGGDGEQKADQPEYVPYERIKIKFQKKWDKNKKENEPSELTTVLFLGDNDTEEPLTYPSDFEKYLRWNCTARFLLQVNKFGCKKAIEKDKKGKQVPRDCGFDITVLQIVITKEAQTSGSNNVDKYRKRMFPKLGNVSTQQAEPTEKKQSKHVSSDESEDDESKKSDDTDDKPQKGKGKEQEKGKVKDAKSESDSSASETSEDEDSPAPTKSKSTKVEVTPSKKQQTKKVNSDSDTSSGSEASDSEDSSSEEKPKPSKKSSR